MVPEICLGSNAQQEQEQGVRERGGRPAPTFKEQAGIWKYTTPSMAALVVFDLCVRVIFIYHLVACFGTVLGRAPSYPVHVTYPYVPLPDPSSFFSSKFRPSAFWR